MAMPMGSTLGIKESSPRYISLYIFLAITIVLLIYYIPDYFFLEKITADHSAFLLNMFGVDVQSKISDHQAFIGNIQIVRDCTGIQVIAVFLGLVLPLPKVSLKRKVLTLGILCVIIYATNTLRVVIEFWLVYEGILPWSLAHYPLSLTLGIIGVFFLVMIADRLMPEIGDFVHCLTKKIEDSRRR